MVSLAGLAALFFVGCGRVEGLEPKEANMNLKKAVFGAGCFWGVEKVFRKIPGVTDVAVGYAGGSVKNPSYDAVCTGMTGHAEAVQVTYNPAQTNFEELSSVFWQLHDPTTLNRQGNDTGTQYRSVIFYDGAAEKSWAEKARAALDAAGIFKRPVVTALEPLGPFYRAEEYHQRYLEKNPNGYCALQFQSKRIGEVLQALRESEKKKASF